MKQLLIICFVFTTTISFAQDKIKADSLYHIQNGEKIYLSSDVDSIARFEKGENELYNFMAKQIKYPADARKKIIEGKVYSSFIVETNGSISDVKIIKNLYESCDNEVIKMLTILNGRWIPAYKNGDKVRMQFILPVSFTLDESAKRK